MRSCTRPSNSAWVWRRAASTCFRAVMSRITATNCGPATCVTATSTGRRAVFAADGRFVVVLDGPPLRTLGEAGAEVRLVFRDHER